ncbi:hypothetical protein LTR17_004909 [Elasticomyces elasticus]|nr:hypothetical protein LTR17_004909 [Elasticomyces elasticus]
MAIWNWTWPVSVLVLSSAQRQAAAVDPLNSYILQAIGGAVADKAASSDATTTPPVNLQPTQDSVTSAYYTNSSTRVQNHATTGTGLSYALSCAFALNKWTASSNAYYWAHGHNYTTTGTFTEQGTPTVGGNTRVVTLCDGHPRIVGPATTPYTTTTWTDVFSESPSSTDTYSAPLPCSIKPDDCSSLYSAWSIASTQTNEASRSVPSRWNDWCETTIPTTTVPTFHYSTDSYGCTVQNCLVRAAYAQLLFWPVTLAPEPGDLCNGTVKTIPATRTGDGPNSIIRWGITVTSPTVLISMSELRRADGCGPSIASTLIPLPPDKLTSVRGERALFERRSFDLADLGMRCLGNSTDAKDCYTAVPAEAYFSNFLINPIPISYISWASSTIWPEYQPQLDMPSVILSDIRSLWGASCLLHPDGVWDPPRFIVEQQTADGPTTPAPISVSTSSVLTTQMTSASPGSQLPTTQVSSTPGPEPLNSSDLPRTSHSASAASDVPSAAQETSEADPTSNAVPEPVSPPIDSASQLSSEATETTTPSRSLSDTLALPNTASAISNSDPVSQQQDPANSAASNIVAVLGGGHTTVSSAPTGPASGNAAGANSATGASSMASSTVKATMETKGLSSSAYIVDAGSSSTILPFGSIVTVQGSIFSALPSGEGVQVVADGTTAIIHSTAVAFPPISSKAAPGSTFSSETGYGTTAFQQGSMAVIAAGTLVTTLSLGAQATIGTHTISIAISGGWALVNEASVSLPSASALVQSLDVDRGPVPTLSAVTNVWYVADGTSAAIVEVATGSTAQLITVTASSFGQSQISIGDRTLPITAIRAVSGHTTATGPFIATTASPLVLTLGTGTEITTITSAISSVARVLVGSDTYIVSRLSDGAYAIEYASVTTTITPSGAQSSSPMSVPTGQSHAPPSSTSESVLESSTPAPTSAALKKVACRDLIMLVAFCFTALALLH